MTDDSIRALLGEYAWRRFMDAFAGVSISFPKRATQPSETFSELVKVLGADTAEKLRLRYAGERIYIAAGDREQRNAEIAARLANGEPPATIAKSHRVFGVTARHVLRIASGMSKTDGKARG
jgi:hypothetical protein